MPFDARVHCAITDAGGRSPNVVQAWAEVLYLVRAASNSDAAALQERVCDDPVLVARPRRTAGALGGKPCRCPIPQTVAPLAGG